MFSKFPVRLFQVVHHRSQKAPARTRAEAFLEFRSALGRYDEMINIIARTRRVPVERAVADRATDVLIRLADLIWVSAPPLSNMALWRERLGKLLEFFPFEADISENPGLQDLPEILTLGSGDLNPLARLVSGDDVHHENVLRCTHFVFMAVLISLRSALPTLTENELLRILEDRCEVWLHL